MRRYFVLLAALALLFVLLPQSSAACFSDSQCPSSCSGDTWVQGVCDVNTKKCLIDGVDTYCPSSGKICVDDGVNRGCYKPCSTSCGPTFEYCQDANTEVMRANFCDYGGGSVCAPNYDDGSTYPRGCGPSESCDADVGCTGAPVCGSPTNAGCGDSPGGPTCGTGQIEYTVQNCPAYNYCQDDATTCCPGYDTVTAGECACNSGRVWNSVLATCETPVVCDKEGQACNRNACDTGVWKANTILQPCVCSTTVPVCDCPGGSSDCSVNEYCDTSGSPDKVCVACTAYTVGASCNDGDSCTSGETIQDACTGACGGGTDVCCPVGQAFCGGACEWSSYGDACDDGNLCTSGEYFLDDCGTSCGGGTLKSCPDKWSCRSSTGACDRCLSPNVICGGTCVSPSALTGQACSDADACTTGDKYDSCGVCQSGAGVLSCPVGQHCESVPGCVDDDVAPVIDVFSASVVSGSAPLVVDFTYKITDDKTGFNYSISYGDGVGGFWGPLGVTSINSSVAPLSHTYQYPSGLPYVVTLRVNDSAGHSVSQTVSVTVVCNPGSPGGNPADQASNCCGSGDASPSCFVGGAGSGACYSDGGAAVCVPNSDRVCTFPGGVPQVHDRDESQTYAVLDTNTCNPVGWTDGTSDWCEPGLTCDTDPVNPGFACGDDPDEQAFTYAETTSFQGDTTTWLGCLNKTTVDASTCFGIDKLDTPVKFTKSASENCAVVARDNDCDGAVPAYDVACYSSVDLQVWINDTQLGMQQARGADVAVTAFDPWVGSDLVLASYDVVTDLNGKKSFALVPPVDVDFSARYPDFDDDTVSQTIAAQQSGVPVSLVLQELSCTSSCTNAATNRCERLCLGVAAGCSLQTENQKLLMDACHPPQSTTGKREGELVILARNETHRLVGVCCLAGATNPVWELAPKTDLVGDMSSLVKYTRLVRLDGLPVRLVVASWKPKEE